MQTATAIQIKISVKQELLVPGLPVMEEAAGGRAENLLLQLVVEIQEIPEKHTHIEKMQAFLVMILPMKVVLLEEMMQAMKLAVVLMLVLALRNVFITVLVIIAGQQLI